jgi:hypothetical protein
MHQSFIPHSVEVANFDILLFIGMDFLEKHRVKFDVTRNVLIHRPTNASQPLAPAWIFIEWDKNMLFTYGELLKLHQYFSIISWITWWIKSLRSFKRKNIHDLLIDNGKLLKDRASRCDTFQIFSENPYRFRVSMPDSILFNEILAVYLFWLEGKAALHFVDLHTHFSAAGFLRRQSVDDVRTT